MLRGRCHCGAAGWRFEAMPESATSCNCTLCRRYGALWIYDFEGEKAHLEGASRAYRRQDTAAPQLEIRFCPECGCVLAWRGLESDGDGRRQMALNLRLAEPEPVAHLPVERFDGLDRFDYLPRDGRCVAQLWF